MFFNNFIGGFQLYNNQIIDDDISKEISNDSPVIINFDWLLRFADQT